ncbi:MAG: dihydroorotase [Gammaproteobacteria bacterium]|nr:dihydroorotase [Gammaproteobacteria bacterium]
MEIEERDGMPVRLSMAQADDWHLHVRDGAMLAAVLPDTIQRFRRAIIMPNLHPPVTTVAAARAYRGRILACVPPGAHFTPLMTLYLTAATTVADIEEAAASGLITAVKYYPAGQTTNSDQGVADLRRCDAVLAALERHDMPLLVHGEVVDADVDVFAREELFVARVLAPLLADFPRLRVVMEHITTASAAAFVSAGPPRLAATITAHHMLLNRNALFEGGIRPHHYCRPLLQKEEDRRALVAAATSGHPRFFLGTDSAPHTRSTKESACGCAGIYTAHAALELYAEIFAEAGALARLEGFASHFGADFYRLPRNTGTVCLERCASAVPQTVSFGTQPGVPFRAGMNLQWRLAGTRT